MTPGIYGAADSTLGIIVDAKGRITTAALATISILISQVQTFTSAATTRMVFFQAANADRTLSNMDQGGAFPRPQKMRLFNLCLDILNPIPVSTAATLTGALNDLALLLIGSAQRPTWTLNISQKAYGPYSLTTLGGTGGPVGIVGSGDGAEIIQFAKNDPSGGWNYFGRVTIPEQVNFFTEINYAATATQVRTQQDAVNSLQAMIGGLAESMRQGRYPWWYPDKAKGLAIDYNVYGTDFLPLGSGATTQNPINISGQAAFCVLSAVLVETEDDNTTFLAMSPLLFRLRDTGSNRELSNIAIHASNWFGTAAEPKYWDVPKIIAPNSTFIVEAQNLEAAERNVRVAFHGFNIYNFRP